MALRVAHSTILRWKLKSLSLRWVAPFRNIPLTPPDHCALLGTRSYGKVATIFDVCPSGFGVTTTVAPAASNSALTLGTSAFGTFGIVSCRAISYTLSTKARLFRLDTLAVNDCALVDISSCINQKWNAARDLILRHATVYLCLIVFVERV